MILLPIQSNDPRQGERRSGDSDRRKTVDRRGLFTVKADDGQTVIRPAPGAARFDATPADVSAFMLDDSFRGVAL